MLARLRADHRGVDEVGMFSGQRRVRRLSQGADARRAALGVVVSRCLERSDPRGQPVVQRSAVLVADVEAVQDSAADVGVRGMSIDQESHEVVQEPVAAVQRLHSIPANVAGSHTGVDP